jgi:hypothetical protein
MTTMRRRLALVLSALAAATVLAACNGEDDGDVLDDGIGIEDPVGGDAEGTDQPIGADDAEGFTDEEQEDGEG